MSLNDQRNESASLAMGNGDQPFNRSEQWLSARTVERNPAVVWQRMDTGTVLVHMTTNRIHELNATASRLWELLETASNVPAIQKQMLSEFDVDEAVLAREIVRTLELLATENLVIIRDADSGQTP